MAKPPLNHEQKVLVLARKQPLLRARDVAAQGLSTVTLTRLVASGQLERVARGVYSLPQRAISAHRSLAEVAIRVPRGVVCLLSALRLHEIGTQAPFEVWLRKGVRDNFRGSETRGDRVQVVESMATLHP